MSFKDFDEYVDKRREEGDMTAPSELFAQWLSNETGKPIIAGPVGEPPAMVAVPDE